MEKVADSPSTNKRELRWLRPAIVAGPLLAMAVTGISFLNPLKPYAVILWGAGFLLILATLVLAVIHYNISQRKGSL